MDLYHDYNGDNELLVVGIAERLQMCKCVILSYGDLGYTDPSIPDISEALGDYTDDYGLEAIKNKIYEILILSQVVRDDEISFLDVISKPGADYVTVDLQLSFGSTTLDVPILTRGL